MTDHRSQIVKRVVHSLEETQNPDDLVWNYFDADRKEMIEATRQTLEATRELTTEEEIEKALDHELVEALRFPTAQPRGLVPWMIMHRVPIGLASTLAAAAATAALVFL